jgi:glutathione S-transferase
LLRLLAFAKPQNGLVSAKLFGLLETVPRFKRWAEETVKQESVNFIWDEGVVVEKMRAKFAPKV